LLVDMHLALLNHLLQWHFAPRLVLIGEHFKNKCHCPSFSSTTTASLPRCPGGAGRLRDCNRTVPQDGLNDGVIHAEAVQVRGKPLQFALS